MFKSLQVCGTSGSGKTTLVRALYNEAQCEPILWLDTKTKDFSYSPTSKALINEGTHPVFGKVYILGSYATICGGCDTIPSVSIVARALHHLSETGATESTCVFEGLMISHMIGTVGEAQKQLGLGAHWRAYLDTSLRQCLDNVLARRKERGQTKPFNPTNTQNDWPRVNQSRFNWEKQSGVARTIRYDHAALDFKQALLDLQVACYD